ncbi:hypothetical protein ACJRPK_15995 [Aquimarina sp. 2-A2]
MHNHINFTPTMRHLCLSFILFHFVTAIFAQQNNDAVFFTQKAQIDQFHTIDDLEELKKGELIELYADRVTEILTVLPLLSLSYEPGVRLSDVGIKEDSHHLKILKKAKDSQQENIKKTHETVEELIPYADTDQIVWTILYFEEVIKKMRMGVKGNF